MGCIQAETHSIYSIQESCLTVIGLLFPWLALLYYVKYITYVESLTYSRYVIAVLLLSTSL